MPDYSDAQIEQEIQDKNLNAPRLTPQDLEDAIYKEVYHHFPDTTVTVCLLFLQNGFIVVGESVAVSPENFDPEIGKKLARQRAKNQLWGLLGYQLREDLYRGRAINQS